MVRQFSSYLGGGRRQVRRLGATDREGIVGCCEINIQISRILRGFVSFHSVCCLSLWLRTSKSYLILFFCVTS